MQHAVQRAWFMWHGAINYVKYPIILASAASYINVRRLTAPYIAARRHTETYIVVLPRACVQNASPYAAWTGFMAPYIAVHRRTSMHRAVRKADASNARSKSASNWQMPYHMTNSSHAIDHFLCMLRYMCCVECCWKSRLTPAVCVLEGAATCRSVRSAWIRAAYPGWTHGMLAHLWCVCI